MSLIIVESPTKARTFNRIFKYSNKDKENKNDYFVFATMGHVRDLPTNKMAIEFDKEFKPEYQIIAKKRQVVSELKKLAQENKEIILATDPDREGESIAYHVAFILGFIKENWPDAAIKGNGELKRIVFHEITAKALHEALEKPEQLRLDLVSAQQSRRILDRIVGYELSPLLWKKMGKNWLSAGRVQTVVLRLIVEREKEVKKFVTEPYYQIFGNFLIPFPTDSVSKQHIKAQLVSKDTIPYEQKTKLQLFAGEYTYSKTTITKDSVASLTSDLQKDSYTVFEIKEEELKRYPPPPHTTSLLSQDAFYRYGFSAKMTMRLAQDLYERGLITYHRTDSFNLSTQFVFSAKRYIETAFGTDYALEKPRGYKTRSKMAQEAHEAIRPTKLEPDAADKSDDKKITVNHKRLYKLIFNRAVSTQMKEATLKQFTVKLVGKLGYEFDSQVQQVVFPGFLKLLNPDFAGKNAQLPNVKQGDPIRLDSLEPVENQTKPPPRYNEASLIKILEEKGIGRPSTYAPILSLIQAKNYVEKEMRYFIPTKLGEAISDYLSVAFPQLFDLNFTAKMEQELDHIAEGTLKTVTVLTEFNTPFQETLRTQKTDTKVIDVEEEVKENCPKCSSPLVVRYSKFGKFLACSNYPKCKFTKPFLRFVTDAVCPLDAGRIVIRFTKKRRRFFGCENYPTCKYSAWKMTEIKNNIKSKGR